MLLFSFLVHTDTNPLLHAPFQSDPPHGLRHRIMWIFSRLNMDLRPVPSFSFRTFVTLYAWPFTRPHDSFSSISFPTALNSENTILILQNINFIITCTCLCLLDVSWWSCLYNRIEILFNIIPPTLRLRNHYDISYKILKKTSSLRTRLLSLVSGQSQDLCSCRFANSLPPCMDVPLINSTEPLVTYCYRCTY